MHLYVPYINSEIELRKVSSEDKQTNKQRTGQQGIGS